MKQSANIGFSFSPATVFALAGLFMIWYELGYMVTMGVFFFGLGIMLDQQALARKKFITRDKCAAGRKLCGKGL